MDKGKERPIVSEEWDPETPGQLTEKLRDDAVEKKELAKMTQFAEDWGLPSADAVTILQGLDLGGLQRGAMKRLGLDSLRNSSDWPALSSDRRAELMREQLQEARDTLNGILAEY